MDLNKEIKLSELFQKKDAKKGGEVSVENLKTYINFAEITTEKKTNWGMAIPGLVLIVLAAFAIAKFGVLDRYARAEAAEAEADALQQQLDDSYAQLAGMQELSEQYYHYTWTDMSAEERGRVNRVRVMELLSYISGQGIFVQSASVKDTLVSVAVTADSLESISRLTESLRTQDIVASCSMVSARTNLAEDEVTVIDVDAQLNIYLNTLSEIEAAAQN